MTNPLRFGNGRHLDPIAIGWSNAEWRDLSSKILLHSAFEFSTPLHSSRNNDHYKMLKLLKIFCVFNKYYAFWLHSSL
jgi:hypothetical protein